jgi:hypothetical protein
MPKVVRDLLPASIDKTAPSGFAKPSTAAVERYCNIPLLFEGSLDARCVKGRIVFDSWADGPAVALRDTADGHIRRLKLKAGDLTLEIVAERRDNAWEFVARVYDGETMTNSFVLKVGGRKFLPQTGGFFVWSSIAVPRILRLESFDTTIEFEKLSWQ